MAKLTALGILALGGGVPLSGCGGGGSSGGPSLEGDADAESEVAQIRAAEDAIAEAMTSAAALTAASTSEEIAAVRRKIDDAQAVLDRATFVPARKVAELQDQIDGIGARVAGVESEPVSWTYGTENPDSYDVADDWGWDAFAQIADRAGLETPTADDRARLLRLVAQAPEHDGAMRLGGVDTQRLEVIGSRGQIGFARWTDGAGDRLHIEPDFRFATEMAAEDRARARRAGYVWGRNFDTSGGGWETYITVPSDEVGEFDWETQTWTHHRIPTGTRVDDLRIFYFLRGMDGPSFGGSQVRRGPVDETGRWLWGEISIASNDLADDTAVEGADRAFMRESNAHVMVHETGHVLGFDFEDILGPYNRYVDEAEGTWTGPNAMAEYGGPVPFLRTEGGEADFGGHLAPCESVMSYCSGNLQGPSKLDLAFLEDIGYDLVPEAERLESAVYGFLNFSEWGIWSVSVKRTLNGTVAEPDDSVLAVADAWGIEPSPPPARATGTVRWNGTLVGVDLQTSGLPLVTGDAVVRLDLARLDDEDAGWAKFDDLTVHEHGRSRSFRRTELQYDLAFEGDTLVRNRDGERLVGRFYGSDQQNVVGTVRDPGAGLLGAFGAVRQ